MDLLHGLPSKKGSDSQERVRGTGGGDAGGGGREVLVRRDKQGEHLPTQPLVAAVGRDRGVTDNMSLPRFRI